MILDIYRTVFERVYIWSPSISVDSYWTPVKRYIQDELKVDLVLSAIVRLPAGLERTLARWQF